MSYVLIENLTKSFGHRVILDNVSLSINEGEKVALVAQNGTGKSTLLKIITEQEEYETGKITKQKGIRTTFLSQDPDLNPESTVHEEIFQSESEIIKAVKMYEESLLNPEDMDLMQEAIDAMNESNAWEYEAKIKEILERLNLHHLDSKIKTFSGGQKKRVALAKILIETPDFLIMDEPTNHLDLEMIDWLETFLKTEKITLLMVTHDRYFLERVCNRIIEISNQNVYSYKGNYSYYLEHKAIREENENIQIDKIKALLKKELDWVRRGPSGRQTKASARVNAYYDTKSNLKEKNKTDKISLDVTSSYMGKKILEIYNLTKSFGTKKITDKFSYSFTKGEKVGIIGKNGVGKSTFLNMIMEKEDFDSGKIVKGETITFGYYTQQGLRFNENQLVIDSVKDIAQYIKLSDGSEISASRMLERFLFTIDEQRNSISKLSGGEKKRLHLLQVLMANPNFLILDEPTNDFDILTLNVLEEFLSSFKGCLIIISHDRYFMDKVVDHLLIFEGDAVITDFAGGYSDYRDMVKDSEQDASNAEIVISKSEPKKKKKSDNQKLYKEITKLERKIKVLTARLDLKGLSVEEITNISIEIGKLNKELDRKMTDWLG